MKAFAVYLARGGMVAVNAKNPVKWESAMSKNFMEDMLTYEVEFEQMFPQNGIKFIIKKAGGKGYGRK